jgi:gamma-glutamyl-gamma-aminobutyrate hydrolase PuuD
MIAFSLLLIAAASAAENDCAPLKGRTLTLGCTYCDKDTCDPFEAALADASHKLKVKVRCVQLYAERDNLPDTLEKIDAVISPGGKDINPWYFVEYVPRKDRDALLEDYKRIGKTSADTKERDRFEYKFFQEYFAPGSRLKEMPALGVCYGMQMMAVANRIPLVIDIHEKFGIPNRYEITDRVALQKNSLARRIFHGDSVGGLEEHHQAVDVANFSEESSPGVRITGTSNGGKIPEILEFNDRTAMGVQFHPEKSGPLVRARVFDWLLRSACRYRRSRE